MGTLTEKKSITKSEVKDLVFTWFRMLNNHMPEEEINKMLYMENIRMKFPETSITCSEDFSDWHSDVCKRFFNQEHEIKMIDVEIEDKIAYVKLIVNWKAETWDPPAPYSTNIDTYAYQTWEIIREPESNELKIQTYIVDKIEDVKMKK